MKENSKYLLNDLNGIPTSYLILAVIISSSGNRSEEIS